MINKFLNYIKYSYHRPTAKIEHFCVLIFRLFLNKKTIANLSEAKKFLLGVRKTDPTKLLQTWAYYNRHE